jgi:hypothetical protein
MYSDKDKQREANRAHAKSYRLRKGMTQGMTEPEGMTVIPKVIKRVEEVVLPVHHNARIAHHPTCRCFVCQPPKVK